MVLVLAGCGEAVSTGPKWNWNCDGDEASVNEAVQECLRSMALATGDAQDSSAGIFLDKCDWYARNLFCEREVVSETVTDPVVAPESPDEALAAELAACEAREEALEELRMDLGRCPGWKTFRDDCRAWETNIEIICAPGPNRELCGREEQADYQTLTQYGSLDEAWEATR
jgi:hypothetical protein